MAPIELTNAITNALQESPVVGNKNNGTLEVTDLLLKPIDRGDVEMVGLSCPLPRATAPR